MERRRFLRRAGAVTATAAAAGCITVSNDPTATETPRSGGDPDPTATTVSSSPSRTADGTPAPGGSFEVRSERVVRDGSLIHVDGVLENAGDAWASARVWFNVLGAGGSRIDRIGTIVPRIEGGTRTQFSTRPYDERVGPDFDSYSLQTVLYSRPTNAEAAEIRRFGIQREDGQVWLEGTVDNTTGEQLDIRVWGSLYDADGLRIGVVLADLADVEARAEVTFETDRFTQPSDNPVDTVSLLAEPH